MKLLQLVRAFVKNLPAMLLALILAMMVWISAVTSSDPTQEQAFPRPIPLQVVGQDPALILVSDLPDNVSLVLSAPKSIWERLISEQNTVRAVIDLGGLSSGKHEVQIQIQVRVQPVKIVSYSPQTLTVVLEELAARTFPIHLVERNEPAIGFEASRPQLSQSTALVSGPRSIVDRVKEVRAVLDYASATQDIKQTIPLLALDANGLRLEGLTISPDQVSVSVRVSQRGGYRNVVVKVMPVGQVASGYRLTNISVFPPTVTVFSSDPKLVENLPGYIETSPLDLSVAKDDFDVNLALNLPSGVQIVGEPTVTVQVGIAAIESSLTLTNMSVQIIGLEPGLKAEVSPERVDVVLSGPLPILERLALSEVRVIVDMSGERAGKYQREPKVVYDYPDLRVEAILPSTVEVTVTAITRATALPAP